MIVQTNTWICEVCDRVASTTEIVSPYSDPVVTPPSGEEWCYVIVDDCERLACPSCTGRGDE